MVIQQIMDIHEQVQFSMPFYRDRTRWSAASAMGVLTVADLVVEVIRRV
jgi:hypothetical protein